MLATILKYLKEMCLVVLWETENSYVTKPEGTLELLCKCCNTSKFLLKNYTGNDFRQLATCNSLK